MNETGAIIERIRHEGIKVVDLRFTDLTGRGRHLALDAATVEPELFDDGILIDGSRQPGWREVTEADLLLKPDVAASWLDPFAAQPTLVLVCDGADPASGSGYERDPRATAKRAVQFLAEARVADRVAVGADIDFFILDALEVEATPVRQAAAIAMTPVPRTSALTSPEAGSWALAAPPEDPFADMRAEIATTLASLGVGGALHAHGRAPGQNQLRLPPTDLVAAADRIQLARYCTHMVAASYGKIACFLPRPLAGFAGAALPVQLSLWQGERPIFAGQGYADLSPACLAFIAGMMTHARALNAFTNPSTNSYRRLRPGEDEPTVIAYAAHNRSAALRVPYAARPEGKRVEARFPDPSANPYLALTALLMAGLDGIERRLEPGDPVDRNLYDLAPEDTGNLPRLASSLHEALDELEGDHEFLMRGEVMSAELVQAYVRVKREEAETIERAPHPLELALYRGF